MNKISTLKEFYTHKYNGNPHAILAEARSELESCASYIGVNWRDEYAYRGESKAGDLCYSDKDYKGKSIIYCSKGYICGTEHLRLVMFTHKGNKGSVSFSTYRWLKDEFNYCCSEDNTKIRVNKSYALTKEDIAEKEREQEERRQREEIQKFEYFHQKLIEFAQLPAATNKNQYIWDKGMSFAVEKLQIKRAIDKRGQHIVIPLYDIHGNISALEKIYDDGSKKSVWGSKRRGAFAIFGELANNTKVGIVEGVGTGATITRASDDNAVLMVGGVNNIETVVEQVREQYQGVQITLYGELSNKNYNVSASTCIDVASKFNCNFVMPSFSILPKEVKSSAGVLSDFDDLRRVAGLKEVKEQITSKKSKLQLDRLHAKKFSLRYANSCNTKSVEKKLEDIAYKAAKMYPLKISAVDSCNLLVDSIPRGFNEDTKYKLSQDAINIFEKLITHKEISAIADRSLTEEICCHQQINYIEIEEFDESLASEISETKGVFIIKAPHGAGKTRLLAKPLICLDEQDYQQPLLLSPRISLTNHSAQCLKMISYKECKIADSTTPSLAMTVNSIINPKYKGFVESSNTLVLDEACQILNHICFGTVQNREQVFAELCNKIKSAKTVVLMDADIDDTTVKLIQQLRPADKINLIEMRKTPCSKTIHHTYKKSELIKAMYGAVEEGNRILVSSNSKSFVTKQASILKKNVKDTRVLLITSDTSNNPDVKAFCENPHTEAKKYNAVFYSPTISAGVSIQEPIFDKNFAWLTNTTTAAIALQMIMRDRTCESIVVGLSSQQMSLETKPEKILCNKLSARKITLENTDCPEREELENYNASLFDKFIAKRQSLENISKNDFANNFLIVCDYARHKVTPLNFDENNKKSACPGLTKSPEWLEEQAALVAKAKDITEHEAIVLTKKDTVQYDEILAIKKVSAKEALGYNWNNELSHQDALFYLQGKIRYVKNLVITNVPITKIQNIDLENIIERHYAKKSIMHEQHNVPKAKLLAGLLKAMNINSLTGEGNINKDIANNGIQYLEKITELYDCCAFSRKLPKDSKNNVNFILRFLSDVYGVGFDRKFITSVDANGKKFRERLYSFKQHSWEALFERADIVARKFYDTDLKGMHTRLNNNINNASVVCTKVKENANNQVAAESKTIHQSNFNARE